MKTKRILTGALASSMAMIMAAAFYAGTATANHVSGGGSSFLFLQPGFTQDIFGVSQHFMGGVAFAPDGDPWVDDCQFSGSHLHRYDAQSTGLVVNTTPLHNESIHSSNAGCGLTNHPNGSMYTNTGSGVVRLNASTGAQTGGPFGPAGNALGIAVDPETGNIIYVGSTGTLHFVNPALTTSGTFSTVTTGNFVDGIAFDPTGDFLFLANRSPTLRLTILNGDTGALIQHALMTSEPDGISFHATTPKFVVTNNTDGTMTRFDFPGDDYTLPPAQSVFASGGFRGDLSQVGSDGCIYLTQAGTRYNNKVVSPENSLVRICGGFAPPIVVEADKEVTDVILDDGSGYPDREGPALQQVSTDPSTRTTTYSMKVRVSTNPIISVVSLEQNNGPSRTDSEITYLASIDDGNPPAQLEGAYIKDAGSPSGPDPDLLTCFSTFDPDNPLRQQLNPCPTEEKIPGDGVEDTAESDLHFSLVQEANTKQRILRFFKLHCLTVGPHTISFYNKAEPKEPVQDPDLRNNWWRAVLELDCVPGAPATLTLDPPAAENPVDTKHCVTATVKDAFGNPVPGVDVVFTVTGSVMTGGTVTTDTNGQATFCYTGPPLPGADVIRAFADSNGSGTKDPGEPEGVAEKTWVLPVSTPLCEVKITNGGWITTKDGDRASFGGNARTDGEGNASGNEEYQDHGPVYPLNMHGNVLAVVCEPAPPLTPTAATIYGKATVDGEGDYFYRIKVEDNGEGGKGVDKYGILIGTAPMYASGDQTLKGGNVQIHTTD